MMTCFCLTNATPCMKRATRHLQVFYTNMMHVTCLAHDLHQIAKYIRSNVDIFDDLVAYANKIFRKYLYRI